MFAVVFGHVLFNNNVATMDGFLWHIPGFLLITGYFGISFSAQKIAKLLGVVYGCYWLTIPFRQGGWGNIIVFAAWWLVCAILHVSYAFESVV